MNQQNTTIATILNKITEGIDDKLGIYTNNFKDNSKYTKKYLCKLFHQNLGEINETMQRIIDRHNTQLSYITSIQSVVSPITKEKIIHRAFTHNDIYKIFNTPLSQPIESNHTIIELLHTLGLSEQESLYLLEEITRSDLERYTQNIQTIMQDGLTHIKTIYNQEDMLSMIQLLPKNLDLQSKKTLIEKMSQSHQQIDFKKVSQIIETLESRGHNQKYNILSLLYNTQYHINGDEFATLIRQKNTEFVYSLLDHTSYRILDAILIKYGKKLENHWSTIIHFLANDYRDIETLQSTLIRILDNPGLVTILCTIDKDIIKTICVPHHIIQLDEITKDFRLDTDNRISAFIDFLQTKKRLPNKKLSLYREQIQSKVQHVYNSHYNKGN